jgi:hypothetical protein
MAYVAARKYGMAAYHRRRGLGISCPGDPSCPGYVAPDANAAAQAAAIQAALALAASGACTCQNGVCVETGNSCVTPGLPIAAGAVAPASTTLTGWLNANTGIVTLLAAGFGLLLFVKGGR